MTHNSSSIGRGQQEWLGTRSKIEPIDSRHEEKLGLPRCLVWGIVFEGAICIAVIAGWSLWLSIR
jgi:hypothetical protein